jgi:tetratricopeptide (TPR) repeat protein
LSPREAAASARLAELDQPDKTIESESSGEPADRPVGAIPPQAVRDLLFEHGDLLDPKAAPPPDGPPDSGAGTPVRVSPTPAQAAAMAQQPRAATPSMVRVGVASVMRWSERFVDRMVNSYDNTFALDREDTADIYMNLGADLARKGNASDAEAALRRTLTLQPDNGLAWFHLGVVLLQQESSATAVKALDMALAHGFDRFEVHYRRAEALADLERHDEAVAALYKALEQQPESAEAAFRLGIALDQLGRFEEAVAAFQIAIAHSPREVSYYQSLGFTLESLGRREEAITYFKRALSLERRAPR